MFGLFTSSAAGVSAIPDAWSPIYADVENVWESVL